MIDICDSINVESSDESEYSEGRSNLIKENWFVNAFPIIGMNFSIEQRNFDFQLGRSSLMGSNFKLELGEFKTKYILIVNG